jgi:hypothetical protein
MSDQAAATPRPWKWADGWKDYKLYEPDTYDHEKYLDLQLIGANGQEVLPMRVDHYKVGLDFDPSGAEPISKSDRELIVRAVNNFDSLLAACKAAEDHIMELKEAWLRGCINETDGVGGLRSNRNVAVDSLLRAAIAATKAK